MTPINSTSIVPDRLYHLDTAAEMQPAMMLGLGLPAHVSGLPAFYYWKDALVVGSYIHPAGKFSLDVTRDKLVGVDYGIGANFWNECDGYEAGSGAMKPSGNKLTTYLGNDSADGSCLQPTRCLTRNRSRHLFPVVLQGSHPPERIIPPISMID